jgi:hypothetical protein
MRALDAMHGEASEVEILHWVQDNRPNLRFYWQSAVLQALQENSDGRGKALFESVGRPAPSVAAFSY